MLQFIGFSSFRQDFPIRSLLQFVPEPTNGCIECLTRVVFVGPKGIANLLFGQFVVGSLHEQSHQLLLHRGQV